MQVFRSTFLSLAPNATESLHTRSAVGFLGKAGGLGGAPLSEGDMHRLARDEVFFFLRENSRKSAREKSCIPLLNVHFQTLRPLVTLKVAASGR